MFGITVETVHFAWHVHAGDTAAVLRKQAGKSARLTSGERSDHKKFSVLGDLDEHI